MTALASYQSQQLSTIILSGHADGSVHMHAIHFENVGYAFIFYLQRRPALSLIPSMLSYVMSTNNQHKSSIAQDALS